MQLKASFHACLLVSLVLIVHWSPDGACVAPSSATDSAEEIVVYNWEGDIPQSVIDAFTEETRIKVISRIFTSQEEAVADILAGKVYDMAVIDGRYIRFLILRGMLKRLNYENIVNFKNISPNFRGLSYDPDNRYSVPYSWGTTGLLVNTELAHTEVHSWADLWQDSYSGKVALSVSYPREAMGMTLKSLGYSANSEKPVEIDAALKKLQHLRLDPTYLYGYYPEFGLATMGSKTIALAVGFSGDLLESRKKGFPVKYLLPSEGLLLWADTFVIPATSTKQANAELFINFLLRPEISAEIVNQKYYASANEAARTFVQPQILADTAIYPTNAMLKKAEIIEGLSEEGQRLIEVAWQSFLAAYPKGR